MDSLLFEQSNDKSHVADIAHAKHEIRKQAKSEAARAHSSMFSSVWRRFRNTSGGYSHYWRRQQAKRTEYPPGPFPTICASVGLCVSYYHRCYQRQQHDSQTGTTII